MRPTRPSAGRADLFRERLDNIINPCHPLVRLAGVVPWDRFDEAFGGFFKPMGRKAKPTRLMVGLHYETCARIGLAFGQISDSVDCHRGEIA